MSVCRTKPSAYQQMPVSQTVRTLSPEQAQVKSRGRCKSPRPEHVPVKIRSQALSVSYPRSSCEKTSSLSNSQHADLTVRKSDRKISMRRTDTKYTESIQESLRYTKKPLTTTWCANDVIQHVRTRYPEVRLPITDHPTWKLVYALSSAAQNNCWTPNLEDMLGKLLPLREHHMAVLSHNMFVTMIGTVVALAFEKGPSKRGEKLNLLNNRYYVRNILSHDSSKTSIMEATICSGIMAMHIDKRTADEHAKMQASCHAQKGDDESPHDGKPSYDDNTVHEITTAMANMGVQHFRQTNSCHRQDFTAPRMNHVKLIETIVNDLARAFEIRDTHTDVDSWLDMVNLEKLHEDNKQQAQKFLSVLRKQITWDDYCNLLTFRLAVKCLLGKSLPGSYVTMMEEFNQVPADPNQAHPQDL